MWYFPCDIQYIPRNMHTVFALLCFVVVVHWLILPYPSGLLHWHCGNLTIAPVPAKQPWWIWIYTSCEFIMNDCITTTKQCTTKPCAYFWGYTIIKNSISTWIYGIYNALNSSLHNIDNKHASTSVADYREVKCMNGQYIPRNMHTVLLCFALLWLSNRS